MTHGSLFSGIGGFDLAAEWMGWTNVFHCEMNPFGQRVLAHHFPNSKMHEDVKTFPASDYIGRIDILTGGFPCQPYSSAGKRLGKDDDRHLWPFMLDIIRTIRPRYVVGENVRGLVNWNEGVVFDEVQADLELAGYNVLPFILPACAVNAPHQRMRVWFIAHANGGADLRTPRTDASASEGQRLQKRDEVREFDEPSGSRAATDPASDGNCGRPGEVCAEERRPNEQKPAQFIERGEIRAASNAHHRSRSRHTVPTGRRVPAVPSWSDFPTFPPVCGGDDGLPTELDRITFPRWRSESIKAYGNAIVPQVALQIFKAIQDTDQ